MTDSIHSFLTGRHKALLMGGTLLVLTGVAALVLLRPGSACQGVFEQTAPRLEANIEIIKNKGGVAISQEKIQELSEGAQKVGLHLKTCCSVLEGGKLNPDQFQQCVERASAYENQVAQAAKQIETVAAARQSGEPANVQQQVTQIARILQSAASEVAAFDQQIIQLAPVSATAPAQSGSKPGMEAEPNDIKNNATVLPPDTVMSGKVSSTDDSDHFKFISGKSLRDRVIAKLENRSETLRPSLTLFGPDKVQLQQDYSTTPGANATIAFTAEPGQNYYLKVDPYGSVGAYTLSATHRNAHDRHEPNDNPARHPPTPITTGTSIDAAILDSHDDDWYVLKAAPGSTLRLRLENRSATLRPSVIVYNAQRSKLHNPYDTTAGASLDFSFEVTPGSSYFFQVSPYNTYGAYRLTLN